jgi:hypothetical protein
MRNIIKAVIKEPSKILYGLDKLGIAKIIPDEIYIKWLFRLHLKKKLNLDNPITMNEKLQWLKLHNRKPVFNDMVDKYESKKYVARIIGEEHIIPTLGVWDRFEDIDFDSLPDKFVLKCTHDSGGLVICKDKSKLDKSAARKKINKSLKNNFYTRCREWPYKDLKPRIIAEKFICDDSSDENSGLTDYKFYCFNGHAECVMLCIDRNIGDPKFYFFNKDWVLQRHNKRGIEAPENFTLPKPDCMVEMFEIAAKLSEGIPYLRVDLYAIDGKVYFGELTFYPQGGFDENRLPQADKYFGDLIDLNLVKENENK